MAILKKCGSCSKEKPQSDFYKNSGCSDGYRSRCKQCESALDFDIDVVEAAVQKAEQYVEKRAALIAQLPFLDERKPPAGTFTIDYGKIAAKAAASAALKRILIIPDCHVPYHDPLAFAVMLEAGRAFKPDQIIILGDFADFYAVSQFSKDPRRTGLLKDELQAVNEKLSLVDALGASEKVYIAGNHEDRLDRFIANSAGALHGLVSIPEALKLEARGWKYVPYKQSYRLGKIYVTHDTGRAGRYAAYQSMTDVGTNTIIGHTHRLSYVVEGNAQGAAQVGAMFGWLGDFEAVDYMHAIRARRDWAHGFGVGYMEPSGVVHLRPIPIVGRKCVIDGRLIELRAAEKTSD